MLNLIFTKIPMNSKINKCLNIFESYLLNYNIKVYKVSNREKKILSLMLEALEDQVSISLNLSTKLFIYYLRKILLNF